MNFADIINKIINILQSIGVNDVIDICILWAVVYYVLKLVNKTRAYQLLKFLAIILFVWGVSSILNLKATLILLQSLSQIGFIALIVIFQPELRRVLEQVSNMDFLKSSFLIRKTADERTVDELKKSIAAICDGAEQMSNSRTGALIVLEKFSSLETVKRSGTVVNADITPELIGTIFYEGCPLHDGAMIIHHNKITHAACVLPLSDNLEISRDYGTRHRAALGLSEVSDALCLVVSEETGRISYCKGGTLTPNDGREELYNVLCNEFIQPIVDANRKMPRSGFLRRRQ